MFRQKPNNSFEFRRFGALAAGLAIAVGAALANPAPASAQKPGAQVAFGVKMAQRGLWSEALFRFKQAKQMNPSDPKVLNNLAVAYEALGQFEQALSAYQEALRIAPSNRELRRNYQRFVEFYQSFRAPDEQGAQEAADDSAPAEGEGEGSEARS